MKQYFRLLSLLLVLMMTSSCSKDDDPVGDLSQPQIIFLFSPGGLGDMSYNDCILEGVQRFKLAQPKTDIYIYFPESLDEAEKIFSDWLVRPESNIPVLFVLATSDYEPVAEKYLKEHRLTVNKSILLFESQKRYNDPNIHTFQISMYGASYLAGATAALCCWDKKALALLANDTDSPIGIAKDGFIAGFQGECDVEYLADKDMNMGSWTGEDMGLVVDALSRGGAPYVKGASGHLRFDAKVFTNVLATTYHNFKVYNGKYIILDYNTSDGGNRTEATLAGWNWKASQMQDFNDSGDMTYPELKGNWALLVASSSGWSNYRHQADVLAIYQRLKASGYTDDRIVLIMEDDIARNSSNPNQGVIRVTPNGCNVYEGIKIDYRMSDLSPKDIANILTGEPSGNIQEVIRATGYDNIFVFWSGHGMPGAMCWNQDRHAVTGNVLAPIFMEMNRKGCYRKLLMMVEACYSGGVLEQCEGVPGMLFITAANGDETSKADMFNSDMKIWMSNCFTSTFIEQIGSNQSIGMRDLYYRLFINTVGSHVMVYNAQNYGNLYTSNMSEFINFKK